jgi:hypothetical protein
MIVNALVQALLDAGYTSGWVVQGKEIVLWENETPQPTFEELGLGNDAD